ncbi:MAG: helix-turn-helix domain-containing protein [Lachnospiraceae bacterium]|nr:helix-turn-helix domain-containing protein [Lachnospiraceae bacterium]
MRYIGYEKSNCSKTKIPHHEFFTLRYLASHPSWVLPKEQIYEAVWKADPEQCGAAVANVVYSLRP